MGVWRRVVPPWPGSAALLVSLHRYGDKAELTLKKVAGNRLP
jgi:hypothetical protein